MLLIDDLIMAPGRLLLWVARQIHDAADQELGEEAEHITAALAELHRKIESGTIGEGEFAACERKLLDRLDELQGSGANGHEADGGDGAS